MGRVTAAASSDAVTSSPTIGLTISGTNRLSYIGWRGRNDDSVVDQIDYGTSNTVYDLGVDESALIHGPVDDGGSQGRFDVFRFFDGDHPSNGAVTITFSVSTSSQNRNALCVVQYDDADQTTGHRGSPVTGTISSATAWDATSITNDSGDIETLGICGMQNNQSHTADTDNPELAEHNNGSGSSGTNMVLVADSTSRSDVGGDWSTSDGGAYWAASIIPVSTIPTLSNIIPSAGNDGGGYTATLTGTGFAPGMYVKFGSYITTISLYTDSTAAVVVVPQQAAGNYDVSVSNDNMNYSAVGDVFTYVSQPLVVGDTSLGLAADNVDLVQAHVLAVGDTSHTLAADNVGLDLGLTLTVPDVAHALAAENVDLVQAHVLAVGDTGLALAADNVDLVQAHLLVVGDTSLSLAADNVDLVQAHVLAVGDTSLALAADNVDLVQAHLLVVGDTSFALAADNVALSTAIVLTVAEATLGLTGESVVLVQAHVLAVDDADLALAADNVDLVQAHLLVVGDTDLSLAADNVDLVQTIVLAVQDATHALAADNVDLVQANTLAVQSATHALTADLVSLSQANALEVDDALHALLADLVTFFSPINTPTGRVSASSKSSRVYIAGKGQTAITANKGPRVSAGGKGTRIIPSGKGSRTIN